MALIGQKTYNVLNLSIPDYVVPSTWSNEDADKKSSAVDDRFDNFSFLDGRMCSTNIAWAGCNRAANGDGDINTNGYYAPDSKPDAGIPSRLRGLADQGRSGEDGGAGSGFEGEA